jgi:hypothetical protein
LAFDRAGHMYYRTGTVTLKRAPVQLHVDDRSPIPIRRQLTEQLKPFIEGGGCSRERGMPSIRERAGFLGIIPNTVARVFEAHLPDRVDRVLLHGPAARLRCRSSAERWQPAVPRFFHPASRRHAEGCRLGRPRDRP